MLKKLTKQATDLILHSIASGSLWAANFLIKKGNEELVYVRPQWELDKVAKTNRTEYDFWGYTPWTKPVRAGWQ